MLTGGLLRADVPSPAGVRRVLLLGALLSVLGAGLGMLASRTPGGDPWGVVGVIGAFVLVASGLDVAGVAIGDAGRLRRAGSPAALAAVAPRSDRPPRRGMWTAGDIAADLALEATQSGTSIRVRADQSHIVVDDPDSAGAAGCELLLASYGEVAHRTLGSSSTAHARCHAIVVRVLKRTGGWFLA